MQTSGLIMVVVPETTTSFLGETVMKVKKLSAVLLQLFSGSPLTSIQLLVSTQRTTDQASVALANASASAWAFSPKKVLYH